jgi:error-prone DNA polymerase
VHDRLRLADGQAPDGDAGPVGETEDSAHGCATQIGVGSALDDGVGTRQRQRVRVAGVKVATQTPPVKSGQRIIFLSLDDATGVADATFFESVHERCAWTVFHTWLLVVEGSVHRSGRRGVSINAEVAWDLRRLMRAWREGWLDDALREGRALKAPRRPFDGRQARAEIAVATGRPDLGQVNGKPLVAGARGPALGERSSPAAHIRVPRTAPCGAPAAPSRAGPNGTTWADPARRHPGVDPQDVKRLAPTDPRHPDHVSPGHRPAGPNGADPPRKLWHSSGGSAGG